MQCKKKREGIFYEKNKHMTWYRGIITSRIYFKILHRISNLYSYSISNLSKNLSKTRFGIKHSKRANSNLSTNLSKNFINVILVKLRGKKYSVDFSKNWVKLQKVPLTWVKIEQNSQINYIILDYKNEILKSCTQILNFEKKKGKNFLTFAL